MALKARMLFYVAATVASATVYSGELRHVTTVGFEGLNFHRPDDVAALYERITYAANQVCGPRSLTGSYYTSPGYARCYAEAMNDAVARVHRPELTLYHQGRLARSAHLASN
jgi:UrcA family protein